MKNYKEFETIELGESDIASVTVRVPNDAFTLNFGKDGSYKAYYVLGEAEIGEHYKLIKEVAACWLKVYDDEKLVFKSNNYCDKYNTLRVYRAGENGCIIWFLKI